MGVQHHQPEPLLADLRLLLQLLHLLRDAQPAPQDHGPDADEEALEQVGQVTHPRPAGLAIFLGLWHSGRAHACRAKTLEVVGSNLARCWALHLLLQSLTSIKNIVYKLNTRSIKAVSLLYWTVVKAGKRSKLRNHCKKSFLVSSEILFRGIQRMSTLPLSTKMFPEVLILNRLF